MPHWLYLVVIGSLFPINYNNMKSIITTLFVLSLASLLTPTQAQDKKEMKNLEKEYMAFTGHGKFYKKDTWSMCKFSVVYKLTSAMTAASMDKNDFEAGKVKAKTSSGAYAILNGLSDEDLQSITDKVAETFQTRMKNELGVTVNSWSSFSDNKHTEKLKESAEDTEIYSKSQGLAYAVPFDGTPHYNRIIVLVPGGKKLAKDLDCAVSEFNLVVDFADMLAEAEAKVKYGGSSGNTVTYNLTETVDTKMYPGVRITPNIGSQAALETGKNIQGTKISAHDEFGYIFSVGLTKDIVSQKTFVESVEESQGEIPAILANRRNNKIEYATTWNVNTTKELYEAAVIDAFNQYMDVVIKLYKYGKG
jgi:hypothetical protein